MTKRRKKYNLHESTKQLAKARLKDCVVVYVSGDNFKRLFSLKHMMPVRITRDTDLMVHSLRWPWTVYIAAFGRDSFGRFYIKAREIAIAGEHLYGEVADSLNAEHKALIEETMPESHLIGVGWIAAPRRCSFDEEQAAKIFDHFDVSGMYTVE